MRNRHLTIIIISSIMLMVTTPVLAKKFWSDFSFTALSGNEYLNPLVNTPYEYRRDVLTLEHASGHSWGSTFTFIDHLSSDDGSARETYAEIGINPSLAKLFNDDRKGKFIKDYFLAFQLEHQSKNANGFNNFLYGAGVSLNIPAAKYLNITFYRRKQDDINLDRGDNNQVTVTWRWDVDNVRFDGFLDIVDSADFIFGKKEPGFNFTPQIKYNIGPMLGIKSGRLDVGIEYVYWKNKFGVVGQVEKNPNLLLKWHF